MKWSFGWFAFSSLVLSGACLEAAISSSVYYLERSRQAEGLESYGARVSVTINEGSLALGAASTAVIEDPLGRLHAVAGSPRNGNVSFGIRVPLERLEDAGGIWKLTINEGQGADENLRILIPESDASAFPIYPQFPEHPFQGDPSRILFVWNTVSASITTGGGSAVSTGGGSSVYSYAPGGPRSVALSHIKSVNGAGITNADGTPRGPVTTQSFESESRMEVFTDDEFRELSGETTTADGLHEFLAAGLVKGGRYAVLGRTGDGPWAVLQRFVAIANAHLYTEAEGPEARSFMIEADPNRSPLADAQTLAAVEDTPLEITLTGSDPDGDELTFEIVTPPSKGTLQGAGSSWTYVPDENADGPDEFTFRADDGAELSPFSEPARVTVDIAPVNDAPVAGDAEYFIMKGGSVALRLPATDPDGDPLTYEVLGAPAKGKLGGTAPFLTYQAQGPGEWSFDYTASDGSEVSAPGTVTLRVRATNQKPVALAASVLANTGQPVKLPLSGSDLDQDALAYIIRKGPLNGTLSGTPPEVFYQSRPGFRGRDQVSFVANDGGVNSKPAVISIQVMDPRNRAPVPLDLAVSGPPKSAIPVVLSASDADGDSLTYRVTRPPQNGTLTGKAPALKFKPAVGFTGVATFSYVANDGSVDSVPATVTVTVGAPAFATEAP